jgi:hypothetical protein
MIAHLSNRAYIAAFTVRRSAVSPAGQYAAAHEVLQTCPVCGTPGFTARGLSAHHCRAKPDRSRLTPDELQTARTRANRK